MSIYSNKCTLKGYEDYVDWFLAWEVYKYLHRNEELLKRERCADLKNVVEDIVVWHNLGNNPKSKYEDVLDFYRFFVTLAKNEDEHHFVLTVDIENYLYKIKRKREERIVRRVLAFIYGDE